MGIMMEREIRELESILKAEKRVFADYLEKMTEQQQYLIENDLKGLKDTVEKIGFLAQEAMTLENGRKNLIEKLSQKLAVDKNDITLNRLLERFKGHNFEELEKLKNAILGINIKATAQKERNELLINQSMNAIRQTIDYLNERNNPRATYENPHENGSGKRERRAMLTRTL